jgi:hypothetical protein
MANNTAYIRDDDVIIIIYEGDQDYNSTKELSVLSNSLYFRLLHEKKPVKAIIDQREIGRLPPVSAWKFAIESIRNANFEKAAIIGKDSLSRQVGKFITGALGKSNQFKFCNTLEEAEQWIRE